MPTTPIRNSSRLLRSLAGLLVFSWTLFLPLPQCNAQDASHVARCGQSTVADAYGPEVAAQAGSFLGKLQRVVEKDDKKQFASLVHYPLRVFEGDRATKIATPSEVVKRYSFLVTPGLRRAILKQSADCLFGNGQGMMIGRGELWFQPDSKGRMKIVTLNLQ